MTGTSVAPAPTVPPGAATRSNRPLVLAFIMLATFMVAMEATIVATAMPRIVGQLGDFAYYGWVFSAYLLAQCTTTLVFGKLSDVFGRKPVINAGILIFLLGSLLCGFAPSIMWLIAFRLLQGIGAGAIQPVTITLMGDLYGPEGRARVQGLSAGVWAGAAVVGPLAGGLIVDHASWPWVFWINLPFGALTIAGFAAFLREEVPSRTAVVDYLGALLFAVATVCLLSVLTASGLGWASLAALSLGCAAACVLFVLQERRAPDPMISFALWSGRLMAASNAASFLAGMGLVGVTAILPLYLQGVMNRTPVLAGVALTTLIVGWTLAVVVAGVSFKAIGVGATVRGGSWTFPAGAALLLLLTPASSLVLASAGSLAMGFGIGLVSVGGIVLVQGSVERSARGAATSSLVFSRSLGNALGATLMGGILALGIRHLGGGGGDALQRLLYRPSGISYLANNPSLRPVFDAALHWAFRGVLALAVLTVVAVWLMPIAREAGHRPDRT